MELLVDKLKVTLDNLGSTERTKPMESNNALDAILHEFRTAQFIRTYGEKRYDKAKDKLKKALSEGIKLSITNAMNKVIKLKATQNVALAEAEHHVLTAQVNPGTPYLDQPLLKLKLSEHLDANTIEKLFADCTKSYSPTTTYIVANKLEPPIQ